MPAFGKGSSSFLSKANCGQSGILVKRKLVFTVDKTEEGFLALVLQDTTYYGAVLLTGNRGRLLRGGSYLAGRRRSVVASVDRHDLIVERRVGLYGLIRICSGTDYRGYLI